ncbi:TonB-dependent receptor [Roseateles violae]|uniref:TonB-dependent siderophore receptor n=1 Tax=Roseateles violae TaxID=3058042 RepID=A0ABT8DKI5_9BURK|nr:TonB-dependent siderophore receptor [Pelomonas sp. PFR6]MDN3918920.1 TonB-dependent siderophore receptor [Pelomonas sp. PFR6]
MSRKHKQRAARAAAAPLSTRLLPLGALAAGFGLASAALAQSAPPAAAQAPKPAATAAKTAAADDEGVLPVVRVKAAAERQGKDDYQATETRIGKGQQELRDIPQSVTIVTEKVMDDRNLDNVKEVLKNTAGITFQAAEGGEEDIRINGFSLQGSGDVFIDGMRDPAFYDRDTFFLDRVELLRGSGALMFGRGSTGGAVNQVTKQAQLLNANQIDVGIGSHGDLRSVGDFNVRTGESSALRVGAMLNRADSNGAGSSIDKGGLAGSYRWGIDEQDEFAATIYGLSNKNGVNYGIPWIRPTASSPVGESTLVPIDPNNYYGMASDMNDGSANFGMLSHTHRFSDNAQLQTRVRYAEYTRDMRASLVRFAAAAQQPDRQAVSLATLNERTVLSRSLQIKKQDMQTLTAQSDFSGRFKAFDVDHYLLAGVDFADEKKQVYAALSAAQGGVVPPKPNTSIGTPWDGASSDESLRSFRTNNEYVSKGWGIYAQDMIQVAPAWKLVAGARYDNLDGDYKQYTIPNNAPGPVTTTPYSMKVSEWSYRGAVLYQPSARMSFHLMGATSFNTSGDAYSLSAANQDIPPEESVNVELGGQIDSADGKLTTRFGIFRTTKLHERNTDPLVNLVTLSGKRHAAGLNVDMLGRVTPEWEIWANFAWVPVAKIDEGVPGAEGEGTRPSLTPRYSGSLWTTYLFTPQLRLGLGLNGRSGQQPNRNPGFYAPKFITTDLMAEYAVIPEELLFRLNVNNVSNKLYADSLYTSFYVPGTGRTVALTGTYKF